MARPASSATERAPFFSLDERGDPTTVRLLSPSSAAITLLGFPSSIKSSTALFALGEECKPLFHALPACAAGAAVVGSFQFQCAAHPTLTSRVLGLMASPAILISRYRTSELKTETVIGFVLPRTMLKTPLASGETEIVSPLQTIFPPEINLIGVPSRLTLCLLN